MRHFMIEPGDLVITDLGLFGYVTYIPQAPTSDLAEVTITPGSMMFYSDQCTARGVSPVIEQQSYWPRSSLAIVEKFNEVARQEAKS